MRNDEKCIEMWDMLEDEHALKELKIKELLIQLKKLEIKDLIRRKELKTQKTTDPISNEELEI